MPAAVAFACGILLDRNLDASVPVWTLLSVCGSIVFLVAERQRLGVISLMAVLGCCLTAGALRHHSHWQLISSLDISHLAPAEPTPVRLSGVIATSPTVNAASGRSGTPSWMSIDQTVCDLACESLDSPTGGLEVVGRVQLHVTGHMVHVDLGDRVEVVGQLVEVAPPCNPGMFDYQAYLQTRGIRCFLRTDHPDAVTVITRGVGSSIGRLRAVIRRRCEASLTEYLSHDTRPLALSLLIGNRSWMPDDVHRNFAQSGTMHLLAISGLHVGILTGLLMMFCRVLGVSVRGTTVLVLLSVASYAFITDYRPPIARAAVLVVIATAAWPRFRKTRMENLLAVCALFVLLLRPSDLFDVGAQLSFLAVMAIVWVSQLLHRVRQDPLGSGILTQVANPQGGGLAALLRSLARGYLVTAAIWLFALPLIAARFHIIAPVGFLLNVLLIPVVALCLAVGYTTLFSCLLIPVATPVLAGAFDLLLKLLLHAVRLSADLPLGHVYVAGPADWWLAGYYVLLAGMLAVARVPVRSCLPAGGLILWVLMGLLIPLRPRHDDKLKCTFLAMGHGCCVVVETPDRRTLLFDAGAFSGGHHGRRVVESLLWKRGIPTIEGAIISHADVDHFNALSELVSQVPVGCVLINRSFLDFSQREVEDLCSSVAAAGVPIKITQADDELELSANVQVRVLHPPGSWDVQGDNAASTVIMIEYANRRVLLTGDLEREGIDGLLAHEPQDVDVMLSPHHGSLSANPRALAAWATPEVVVVSGGDVGAVDMLRQVYGCAERVLSTAASGAITIEIAANGELSVDEFLGNGDPRATRTDTATATHSSGQHKTPMNGR